MPKRIDKSHPSYLDQLGAREGLSVAKELYRENPKAFDESHQLTVAEYQFLLKWATDRLHKTGELPRNLTTERFGAFEHSFYSTLRHEGML